jgi:hypothetical protein
MVRFAWFVAGIATSLAIGLVSATIFIKMIEKDAYTK